MSKENESIILFTLNYKPKYLAKLLFTISLFASLALLLIALVLNPLSKQKYKEFIHYKKIEAKLNIQPNKFGQKFSDWMVFISDVNKSNGKYKNIVLLENNSKDNKKESFVLAKEANFKNDEGNLNFALEDGKAFLIKEQSKIQQINYKKMNILYNIDFTKFEVNSILEYWQQMFSDKKIMQKFIFLVLISLFPLLSFFFAVSIGIVNYRYEKRNIYLHIFLVIFIYYALAFFIQKQSIIAAGAFASLFFIASYFAYKKFIVKKY
jgi:lipopolysaccharide export system permease protein